MRSSGASPSPAGELSDGELLDRARSGDPDAFSTLAERHWEWLVRLCRRHLDGDSHQAEDVAQECLVKLFATMERDARPLQPRAWLSVVARHACIDVHRGRRADPVARVPDHGTDEDPFDADPILGEAWESLTDRHRAVLHHRELMGLSYEEIATVMEISVSAVETLLFRARAALRRNYRRAGGKLLGCGLFGTGLMRAVDGGERPEVAPHLTACSTCSAAVDRLGAAATLLRSGKGAVPSTPALVERARDWLVSALSGPATALAGPATAAAPAVGAAIAAAVVAIAPLQDASQPQWPVRAVASPDPGEGSPNLTLAPTPGPPSTAPVPQWEAPAAPTAQPWFEPEHAPFAAPSSWMTPRQEWRSPPPTWVSPAPPTAPVDGNWDQPWATERPDSHGPDGRRGDPPTALPPAPPGWTAPR